MSSDPITTDPASQTPGRLGLTADRRTGRRIAFEVRLVGLDVLMLIAAAVASGLSASATGNAGLSPARVATFSVLVLVLLAMGGAYRHRFTLNFLNDLRTILAASAVAALGVTFVDVLLTDHAEAASQAVRQWLFAAVYLAAGRAGFQLVQSGLRQRGIGGEPTLLVGAGSVGNVVARRLIERPEFGLGPVAFLDPDPLAVKNSVDLPVVGRAEEGAGLPDSATIQRELEAAVFELRVTHVIIGFSSLSHEAELAVANRCRELGVSVSLVPRLFEGIPDQTRLERLGGLPLITVQASDPRGAQFAVKYAADRTLAALGLVLTSPILLATAAAIAITNGRPVLFRQRRCGLDGVEFEMLKFRTMKPVDADKASTPLVNSAGEALAPGGALDAHRRTRLGAFMRRASLDELPQLVNVVRGEMSLVGPRPERPEFTREFVAAFPRYDDRHRVRSGITGWAQVHDLRGNTSLADRIEWDNYYIENWSPWLDVRILLMTARAVVRGRGE